MLFKKWNDLFIVFFSLQGMEGYRPSIHLKGEENL
jgi:hypothetical protein